MPHLVMPLGSSTSLNTPLAPVAEKTAFDGKFAMSTSLGFGGCNTALIVGEEC